MEKKFGLGIGIVSKFLVEEYHHGVQNVENLNVSFIASRGQVETKLIQPGYVYSTEDLFILEKVKEYKKSGVMFARDHGGPGMGARKIKNFSSIEMAVEEAILSFEQDINNGFEFIHIDCCQIPQESKRKIFMNIYEKILNINSNLKFEFGEDEQIINPMTRNEIDNYLFHFIKDLHYFNLPLPEYVVLQLGTKTIGNSNTGKLKMNFLNNKKEQNIEYLKEIAHLVHNYGLKIKMHNGDYFTSEELTTIYMTGIDAINIAPEYATLKSSILKDLLIKYEERELLKIWKKMIISDGKWQKWEEKDLGQDDPYLLGGHYVWSELIKLKDFQDFNIRLKQNEEKIEKLFSIKFNQKIIELDNYLKRNA